MMAMAGPVVVEKPKLRGASHAVAFVLSFALTAWLVSRAHTTTGKLGCGAFGFAVALLFGTSALYHRIDWTAEARARMRKLDHSAIFVLIAGGYTPLLAIVPAADGSRVALVAMWAGALLGVVKSLLWAHAPKWVTAVVCVVLGWTGAFAVYTRVPVTGGASALCIIGAGVLYSVGALVYAKKKPDPWPAVFGYHEVFHALVIVATLCLYVHADLVLRAVGG
ncbi:MAG: hemolysin III family protein [Myxococcales bacterium]|nr:hemolysin III family protein [Myxococcales bacterium]